MSTTEINLGRLGIRYLIDGSQDGNLGIFELTVPPASNVPPPHSHSNNEEIVYVLEGTLRYSVGGDTRDLAPGQSMDPAAVERLSKTVRYNAQMRTTCVATMLEGGHAANALPQTARATVNCRILPGEPVDEVLRTLVRVLADDQISDRKSVV